ncbi:zf-HC2 domain-containing protein [Rhizobium sp. XQZ8]|uniref:zf-HC2 domain-containing protein n=1 Tax=Rhizobium populisoli TaxID=2859785 RepID=UPI001CA4C113|nr:zf-HC2 domain-containing protein [Rhizobium populisoli]MBW6421701.1 zf-HC2 domain-containing protein [Rhizobium populisoli]
MTKTPMDELLVAYLDGELDAARRAEVEAAVSADAGTAARLATLRQSDLPFSESFEPLLGQAPQQKLEAMLAAIPSPQTTVRPARSISRRGLIAAALGCLVSGIALDRAFIAVQNLASSRSADEEADWRGEVAEYLALYTPETLRNMTIEESKRTAQLQHASQRLGLQLDPFAMSLGGLEMRRTQVLEYDGKPLGQIMYLDPQHGPVALCIIASTAGSKKMRTEQRSGLNLVYWSSDTHAFVMAARNPIADLHARAEEIRYELADRNQV